jgi:hypothetical protein
MTSTISNEQISELAFYIYLREHCPDGQANEHWMEAEQLLHEEHQIHKDVKREENEGGIVDEPSDELIHTLQEVDV